MFAPRTATGLTLALLALPATATATPPDTSGGGGGGGGGGGDAASLSHQYGWGQTRVQPNPDQRSDARTSSLAGTTSPPASPDAADAARAGQIAHSMEHYHGSQPIPAAARPASPPEAGYRQAASDNDSPAWPEIAFAGFVLLATAGGVVRVRMRRSQRVTA